ncbi:MAG: hypothetical protein ABI963_15410 [Rhizomicrobium sp.]
MPRYFFHILHPDISPIPDREGADYDGLDAAKQEAVASVRDLVAEAVKYGTKVAGLGIEIWDDAGQVLKVVHAKDAFS